MEKLYRIERTDGTYEYTDNEVVAGLAQYANPEVSGVEVGSKYTVIRYVTVPYVEEVFADSEEDAQDTANDNWDFDAEKFIWSKARFNVEDTEVME